MNKTLRVWEGSVNSYLFVNALTVPCYLFCVTARYFVVDELLKDVAMNRKVTFRIKPVNFFSNQQSLNRPGLIFIFVTLVKARPGHKKSEL